MVNGEWIMANAEFANRIKDGGRYQGFLGGVVHVVIEDALRQ
jgi:hypothetical protein